MRWAGLAAILVIAACAGAGTPQAGGGSPSPVAAATPPAATPTAVDSPSPTPAASASPVPIVPVDFSCRLPFLRRLDDTHAQAGFIDFPAGTFSPDAAAPAGAAYYDRAVSRWLPVGGDAVAPDGLRYAFMTGGSPSATPGPPRLHIVDAGTGVERVLDVDLPGTMPYGVLAFRPDGVYIGSSWEGTAFGYWRVDPSSGAAVALGTEQPEFDDGSGHSWRLTVGPRDPHPALSALSGQPLPDEIVRHDTRTGLDEIWFYRPGFNVSIKGHFVGGGVLVWTEPAISETGGGGHEYWLAAAPGRSAFVAEIEYGGQATADGHGVWMGGLGGLYLFTPDGKVRLVSHLDGDPANGCSSAGA